MAQMTDGKRRTFKAGAGLTASQYTYVKQDVDGTVILATAATDKVVGILVNHPAAGDNANVTLLTGQGTEKITLGAGGCAIGDYLTATAAGAAIVTTTNKDKVIGQALQAGNAGDIVEALITNFILNV